MDFSSLSLMLPITWWMVQSLENGLARTPPMGWLSWERFRCNTDCDNDPDNCIRASKRRKVVVSNNKYVQYGDLWQDLYRDSRQIFYLGYFPVQKSDEYLFKTMADLLIAEGYAAVGYEYINIDDCWLEKQRSSDDKLVADRKRFPSGILHLSNYIHSKGLKFGIYEDYGNYTCAGYPGILGYQQIVAQQFKDWEVDYVKLDGCYASPREMDRGYANFQQILNSTGRHMIFSCSWPVYQIYAGIQPNLSLVKENCNLWRSYDDIQDSWASVESIIDYFGNNQEHIAQYAGPGHWNDPDMLIVGNFGLSYDQAKTQFAIWSILAAPLLISVDLRTIRPEFKDILQNKKIIDVNQDSLGLQGRRIYKHKGIEIWSKPIKPVVLKFYSYAVAFVNRRTDGTPSDVAVTLKELGLVYPMGYRLEDLYEKVNYGILFPNTKIKVKVNPTGVVLLKAEVQPDLNKFNIEDVNF